MHALARSLGVQQAAVVGHDIGLMVTYGYAALFPAEVSKLVLMDAFLPGIGAWETIYDDPDTWHFRFHGPTPEALVKGRERIYFEYFWNHMAADSTRSLPEDAREAYTGRVQPTGSMRAAWGYFESWPQTATDFANLGKAETDHAGPHDRWQQVDR